MLRVLLLADTHLGFDQPLRPRVERPRRGPDFFRNTELALQPALDGRADVVVHAGDLLFRSRVQRQLVLDAFAPLLRVASAGVPVVLVPGNHERSSIPFPLLVAHRHLHVFSRPETFLLEVAGYRVAFGGFPCVRKGIGPTFRDRVAATGLLESPADLRFLVIHQTVEGARVGPADFQFRPGADVVRGSDVPSGVAAVLAGHIHRAQVLEEDLAGCPFAAPVLYPGSVERTSFAERAEPKGFLLLRAEADPSGGRLVGADFEELPARPLIPIAPDPAAVGEGALRDFLRERVRETPPRAVVRIHWADDGWPREARPSLAELRGWARDDCIVEVRGPGRTPQRESPQRDLKARDK